MTDNVFINRERNKVVPTGSIEAKWQISRAQAVEMGLLDSKEKPVQARRPAFDATKAHVAPQRRRNAGRQGQNRGRNQDA